MVSIADIAIIPPILFTSFILASHTLPIVPEVILILLFLLLNNKLTAPVAVKVE